ncbi:MAG: hypothetical protein S4CHLAM45_02010 [Chlamydiales bacterium]|nr:hypothetical protein [Chlamydiales bacterium]MCH9620338.1 hypothetical protein [Chlamydiales bacterium]MCH9622324.1 hypothetical protein [Chlamydiales bacterium]
MREIFYYSIGFIPSLFFGLRFFIQWIQSERKKTSFVSPLFWKLSICGNLILALHYFIQSQFPLLMIQVVNCFIAWRNLNLSFPRKNVFIAFFSTLSLITFAFTIQRASLDLHWMEVPLALSGGDIVSLPWHLIGLFGSLLFASRFWLQWWQVERTGRSHLSRQFWVISIAGSLIALSYFVRIGDYVSICNALCGLIPYLRNLVLSRSEKLTT